MRSSTCFLLLEFRRVPGVKGSDGETVARLDADESDDKRTGGVLKSGMLPKVSAALAALEARPRMLVKIAPAGGTNAILDAMDAATGTTFANAAKELGHG